MGDANAGEVQIIWEHKHLFGADGIVFWFPCETLCPIALFELGSWLPRKKKIFVGCHPNYKRKMDVKVQCGLEQPELKIVESLDDMVPEIRSWAQNKVMVRKFVCGVQPDQGDMIAGLKKKDVR